MKAPSYFLAAFTALLFCSISFADPIVIPPAMEQGPVPLPPQTAEPLSEVFLKNDRPAMRFDLGHVESQDLYYINIFPVRVCEDDGTLCGTGTVEALQTRMDGTNALLFRSDSKIRVRLTYPFMPASPIRNTEYNSNCTFPDDIRFVTMTIGDNDVWVVERLTDEGDWVLIEDGDLNGDGNIDELDAAQLCVPIETASSSRAMLGKAVLLDGNGALVFLAAGTRTVVWEEDYELWTRRGPTPNSACFGYVINHVSNLSDANGNSFSHELGHYLCNTHTFAWFNKLEYADLTGMIISAREELCPDNPLTCDPDAVIEYAFDKDDELSSGDAYLHDPNVWWEVENSSAEAVRDIPVADTPADANTTVWAELWEEVCLQETPSVLFNITGVEYTLEPDRTNIMSYFKHCFPRESHFSPNQIERAELCVSSLHRQAVTDEVNVTIHRSDTQVPIPDATRIFRRVQNGPPPQSDANAGSASLQYATSYIFVEDEGPPFWPGEKRVIVGVDIYQARNEGGLHIELVDPEGTVHVLQGPDQNESRVGDRIKTLFYLESDLHQGLWMLRVAEEPNESSIPPAGVEGYIAGWHIQFETPIVRYRYY